MRAWLLCLALLAAAGPAYGETVRQAAEDGMDITITYPASVISGNEFEVTLLVENNGWEAKENVTFAFDGGTAISQLQPDPPPRGVAEGGSFGHTARFSALSPEGGSYFLNIVYGHAKSGQDGPAVRSAEDIAIPVQIKPEPEVSIRTSAPESVFAGAEFPFEVRVLSKDADLHDVTVRVVPPRDIQFRGETMHAFSSVARGEELVILSEIVTRDENVASEHTLPFEVVVQYEGPGGAGSESVTAPLLLRPRSLMEITTDGGIWIGSLFIAPYVSIGTIVGIPAGTILSLLIRRAQNRRRK